MMIFIYNILFPIGFILFIPSIIKKLIFRSGKKDNFPERFGIFSQQKKNLLLKLKNPVWIHSVSVGETQIALNLIRKWKQMHPEENFVLSTTTTTAQLLAHDNCPPDTVIIFCPIDFFIFVKRAIKFINPSVLVILETEIWPNMVCEIRKKGIPVALVNARISDKSIKGYKRFSFFFGCLLKKFSLIAVQTDTDYEHFLSISNGLPIKVSGNMKFDQTRTQNVESADLRPYFGDGKKIVILGASTHPREEKLIAEIFKKLKNSYPDLKLVIVPRHAERGREISEELSSLGIRFHRKTSKRSVTESVDCLLADTTGEMSSFMGIADIVIMGKSLAGHHEGHNIIEPAMFEKAIITGSKLDNFKFILDAMKKDDALITVDDSPEQLERALIRLIEDLPFRIQLGKKAGESIAKHCGATEKTINSLKKLLNQKESE